MGGIVPVVMATTILWLTLASFPGEPGTEARLTPGGYDRLHIRYSELC